MAGFRPSTTTVLKSNFLNSKSSRDVDSLKFFTNGLLLRTERRMNRDEIVLVRATYVQDTRRREAVAWQSQFPPLRRMNSSSLKDLPIVTWRVWFETNDERSDNENVIAKKYIVPRCAGRAAESLTATADGTGCGSVSPDRERPLASD